MWVRLYCLCWCCLDCYINDVTKLVHIVDLFTYEMLNVQIWPQRMWWYGKISLKTKTFCSIYFVLYWCHWYIWIKSYFWYKVQTYFVFFIHRYILYIFLLATNAFFCTNKNQNFRFNDRFFHIIYIPINCLIWSVKRLNQAYCTECL